MARRSVTGRSNVDYPWISLGVGDEFRDRVGWNRWMELHHERSTDEAGDGRNVTNEIEIEPFVQCGVYGIRNTNQKQRIAIGGRLRDGVGPNVCTRARSILDDERLPQTLGQPLADQARRHIGRASRWKSHDDAGRPRRIAFPTSNTQKGR